MLAQSTIAVTNDVQADVNCSIAIHHKLLNTSESTVFMNVHA